MEKSADAFRTISEVAEDLVLPQHVLRFWETRFPQIRPLKRAGGRRYYRPTDVILLRSIRQLLYDDGYTIKGVQRLLKEQGARGLRVGEPSLILAREQETVEPTRSDRDGDAPDDMREPAGISDPLKPDFSAPDNKSALREALIWIEECERIIAALYPPVG